MALPRTYGNRQIARRIVNGGNCRLLMVGDSILSGLGAAFDRCWNPPKRTGAIGGTDGSANNSGHFGTPNDYAGEAAISGAQYSPGLNPSTAGGLGALVYTTNGSNLNDEGFTGGQACLGSRLRFDGQAANRQRFRQDWVGDAVARGVDLTAQFHVYKSATGIDNFWWPGYTVNNGARLTNGPKTKFACSGSGVSLVSQVISHADVAIARTGQFWSFGWGGDNGVASTNAKTITFDDGLWHVTTGEVGFEVGNISVGGAQTSHWAAAGGVMLDSQLSALCADYGVTDFYIALGTNGGDADYSANIAAVISRLRGFVPGAGVILASGWQCSDTTDALWQDYTQGFAKLNQAVFNAAQADGNALYLNVYDHYGPNSFTWNAGTSGGGDYLARYGIGDGTHVDDLGYAATRYGELTWGMLNEASASAAGKSRRGRFAQVGL